jgi:hypothetical protein
MNQEKVYNSRENFTIRDTIMSAKKIMWEKWRDPYGFDEETDDGYHDNYDGKNVVNEGKPMSFLATPFCIMPLTENTCAGKVFNFWTGHTNFNITRHIAEMISKIDGVETINIFTRYRLKIGVGKAFSPEFVLQNINNSINKYFGPKLK